MENGNSSSTPLQAGCREVRAKAEESVNSRKILVCSFSSGSRRFRALATLFAGLVLLQSLLLFASGCNELVLRDPQEIVRKAIDAQKKLKSARVEMDFELDIKRPGEDRVTSTISRSEGYFEQPDKTRLEITSGGRKTQVITIGDKTYMKTPDSSHWVEKSSKGTFESFGPRDAATFLRYTKDLKLKGIEENAYHLSFTLAMERYAKAMQMPGMSPEVFKGSKARMQVWVLTNSFYVEKMEMKFFSDATAAGIGKVWTTVCFEFSEFGKPANIEAPI